MLGTLFKMVAYARAPTATFASRHPRAARRLARVPSDSRAAYAPRLAALATALVVAPLAYRLGKRAGQASLLRPPPSPPSVHRITI